MAKPIEFRTSTDPRKELQCKLASAPREHAEALLATLELLETAHQKGVLDLLRGAIGSKNAIAAKISEYAAEQQSTQVMRNLLVLSQALSKVDLGSALSPPAESQDRNSPSLWESLKILRSDDGRRGLYSIASLMRSFGASLKRPE